MPTTIQKSHKLYAIFVLASILAAILVVALTNRLVDPYGIWPAPRIAHFNIFKTRRHTQDYLFKPMDLVHQQPHTLFIGSSRTAFAMTPDSEFMHSRDLTPAYNSALREASPTTIRALLEHALMHNPKLETVVWGMDFFAFNTQVRAPEAFSQSRLMRSSLPLRDLTNTHISARTFIDSLKTVADNKSTDPHEPYTPLGQLTTWDMQANVEQQGMTGRFEKSVDIYLNSPRRFDQFSFSEQYWNEILHIKALAAHNSITLKIYVSPVHMILFEAMEERQIWDDYLVWLERLAGEFDYWDYSLPNPINTEKIDNAMQNYWDASHFRSHVGERVLKDLFDPAGNETLGTLVTAENVEAHIQAVAAGFRRWRTQYPTAQQFVDKIAR